MSDSQKKNEIIGKVWYLPKILSSTHFCWGRPVLVHVVEYVSEHVYGALTEQDAIDDNVRVFLKERCLPATVEFTHLCKQHLKKRETIDDEFAKLVSIAQDTDVGRDDGSAKVIEALAKEVNNHQLTMMIEGER
jgi:hypothetical protein